MKRINPSQIKLLLPGVPHNQCNSLPCLELPKNGCQININYVKTRESTYCEREPNMEPDIEPGVGNLKIMSTESKKLTFTIYRAIKPT